MEEHFTERFASHRRIRLAADGVAKPALHHGKHSRDIRQLVVALQKVLPPLHATIQPPQARKYVAQRVSAG